VTLTKGMNSFPKFREKLFEDKDLDNGTSENLGPGRDVMCLAHEPCAYGIVFTNHVHREFFMHLGHGFPCSLMTVSHSLFLVSFS